MKFGKGKKDKKKIRKEDISLPTNFQHVSHVGWDPNKGFDLENVDPKLKQFFSKAGVSERELQVCVTSRSSVTCSLHYCRNLYFRTLIMSIKN